MPSSLAHQIDLVVREQAAFARFARRRERFLDALDWDCLDPAFAAATAQASERIDDLLAEGLLFLAHLEERLCAPGP